MADYRIRVIIDPSGAVAGSRAATNEVKKLGAAVDDVKNRSAPGMVSSLKEMGGALKIAAIIGAVTAYARVSDAIATARGQLRLATKDQAQLNYLQKESYRIAQRQGVAYAEVATLVAKATKAATSQGMEMTRAMEAGKNVAAAVSAGIKVSGTNSQAAAAGVLQLSQALASGTLRGDELNSVMENIPAVGDAIAKAMGRSSGELRKMGAAGELTSKAITEALEKARPELEAMADMIPLTFGAAFQKVKNAAGNLLTSIDQEGVGFGGAIIAGLDLLSKALDGVAANADTVSNIIIGTLVAAAVKSAVAATAAGAAVRKQASDNLALAESSVIAARAQQQQALASLAVARANGSLGGAGASAAAANVVDATRKLAGAQAAAKGAEAALAGASARAGLFGRALAGAASLGRAALAAIGGPIGLAIAGLVALVAWAGKAALSFKPIAGEAATVSDYIMEAFSQAGKWVGEVANSIWKWMKNAFTSIQKMARTAVVWLIDAFLSVGRAVAGVAGGIIGAFKAAATAVGDIAMGIAADAQAIFSMDWGAVGAAKKAAAGAPAAVAAGYRSGSADGSAVFGGASGESVVKAVEALPGQIGEAIMGSDLVQGLRKGANDRAKMRADAQKGGATDPGSPVTAGKDGKAGAGGSAGAGEKKKTFEDILDEAKEQTRLAGLLTNEQEVQNALISARRDLERDLSTTEKSMLETEIRKKQTAAANLELAKQTADLIEQTAAARVQAQAEEARMAGDYGRAAAIEAELKVQLVLNQAKREGVILDQKKVEAYRAAAIEAAKETEITRLQQEAKRQMQEIADNARKSIQTAVSDGLYSAFSGDIKGVKGMFNAIGNILRRQMAETIAAKLFSNDIKAKIDGIKVTQAAVDITVPAAQAVTTGTDQIVTALTSGAEAISAASATAAETITAGSAGGAAGAVDTVMESVQDEIVVVASQRTKGIFDVLKDAFGKVGGFIQNLIKPGGAASRALAGAKTGLAIAGIGKMLGIKTSSTGGAIGGAIGNFIPGLPPGVGKLIGGAIGSIVGGMLKKTKTGAVTVSSSGVGAAFGNNSKMKEGATGAGNSIVDRLREYAKALGGSVGSFGNITIGQRDGKWRVNETGTSLKTKKGAKDFGDDAEAALEYAIKTAIQRGALTGLSAGVSAAIKSGVATVQEAIDFTNSRKKISRQALALVDPVRAAIADVDDEFSVLLEQYKKFGEDTTDLEKVYLDKRQKAIDEALAEQMSGIKQFIAELKGGALGGASLVDRAAEQNRLFTAIETAQREGRAVDYDQLNTVGRALIEATRELEGATPDFYAQVDRVMAVLEAAIANSGATNVTPLPAPIQFRDEVAVPIVNSIYNLDGTINQTSADLLAALNAQSQAIVRGNAALYEALTRGGINQDFNGYYDMVNFR